MRLEQLRYLSDIQHTNSISKTANRFFLSQQSLSNNIRQLEKELNVVLLERSPFGVILTKEARALLEVSDPFLQQYDDLQTQFSLQQMEDGDTLKHIRIFNSSALTSIVLPKAISIFSKRHPKVRISIKEVSHRDVFPSIMEKSCSVAFLSINEEFFLDQLNAVNNLDAFHYNIMLTDRLVACVPAYSPLAEKEIIEQSDIVTRPFTYLNIVPLVKNDNVRHNNLALYTSSNIEFHRRILQEIDVVSLMPRYVYANLFENKHVVAKPLEGAQQTIYHATLYPDAVPNPLTKELVNIVTSII